MRQKDYAPGLNLNGEFGPYEVKELKSLKGE
jgi:hypothetical protein